MAFDLALPRRGGLQYRFRRGPIATGILVDRDALPAWLLSYAHGERAKSATFRSNPQAIGP